MNNFSLGMKEDVQIPIDFVHTKAAGNDPVCHNPEQNKVDRADEGIRDCNVYTLFLIVCKEIA